MTCLGACVEALGTGNPGEDWKSALIKEASEKLRLRMEQNFLNDQNGLSVNNSYLIELKGASSKKYVGDWLDERGEAARLFSDLELSGFDKTLLGLNTSKGLVDKDEAVYLVVINDWKLFLETKLTEPSEINNLNQFNAQKESIDKLRLQMGEVPLQIINEVSAAKQRQNVHLYLFSRINVFDRPDEKNQEVSPRSFIYTSFSESRQRLLLKGISELDILGRAGLIRQNLEILEGYYADGTSATTGNSLLSRSFTDHVQEKKYGNSQAINSLIEEITKELDKRHEALLEDYGKVKVEELSAIEKIFFLHGQEFTEKNLNKYLTLLRAIEKGAIETEELIKGVDENNYEELQNISRLTDINIASMLSWEAREKLLTAWAEKDYLADNGWLGYDERKVIELLARTPRTDSERLITFFKNNNHKYLLKFYDDIDDAGGIDNNTLFIETLVEVSKQLVNERLQSVTDGSEAEKILTLYEQGFIKALLFVEPSSSCENPFGFSESGKTSYNVTTNTCHCAPVRNGEAFEIRCYEMPLVKETLSPLDLAVIIRGEDISILEPEGFLNNEYQAEIVPAIYFKYQEKEKQVKLAGDAGMGALTVLSFAIPGTVMVRAAIGGRYLVAALSGAELLTTALAEITSTHKAYGYLVSHYGEATAKNFVGTVHSLSLLSGNLNGPATAARGTRLADELTSISRNLPETDLRIFLSVTDDLEANASSLVRSGNLTFQQVEELKNSARFVRTDLARAGKGGERVKVVQGGGKFTLQQINDYVTLATKNKNESKVMLGKYLDGGPNSYIQRAGTDHTYFDLGSTKWKEAEELVNKKVDEMWKINKKFIDEQKALNKEFYFSQEPWKAQTHEYLSKEAEYLIDLGAKDFQKINDNLWKVIW